MSDSYECDGCGACCRTKLVDVFEENLLREQKLGPQMQPLREPGLDGEIGYLTGLSGGACPFLNGDNRCGIYPTRPVVYVFFPAGSDDCQEARQTFGLPSLEPTVKPQT